MEYSYYAGIDVSLEKLTVVVIDQDGKTNPALEFDNDAKGQRRLASQLRRLKAGVHACLEPTNVYHLQLAMLLHAQADIDVSVISTSAARHFAQAAMQRAKTDRVDALTLAEYARVHRPKLWQPPRREALELRSLARRIGDLVKRRVAVLCKIHSAERGQAAAAVLADLNAEKHWLTGHIDKLRKLALAMIKADAQFARWYKLLLSVPGIHTKTAIYLIGEYGVLPPGLTKRQWVALAGLDPQLRESGKSVNKPRHISKQGGDRVRAALFLPASIASRRCREIGYYRDKIQAKTGRRLPALCAVMRKMLQAIWGMFHHDQIFNPSLFCQK